MINFLKNKNKNKNDMDSSLIKITALLIHAAKIDENYTEKERKIIRKAIVELDSKDNNIDEVLLKAEEIEKNSNQLLEYTNIIKQNSIDIKKDIIEHLWKVIISDKSVDQYESNLMRRICGLIYFPDKESAEIKLKLINNK